jgi:surface antigen
MRIAVLTGVFACAVIFAAGTAKADAATLQTTDATPTVQTIERMVAVAETTKSPLLEISTDELKAETVQEEAVTPQPKKHIIGENESLSKIAESYGTTWQRIFDKNTQLENPNIISQGTELVIPEADEVLEKREFVEPEPVVVARPRVQTATTPSQSSYTAPRGSSSGNGYVAGYCTWYVKNRRPDLPNNLGNAYTWASRAAAQGLATGSTPRVGAVGQQGNHVVYIESVNSDGTVTVSDMNWSGRYVITTRTVPASNFRYIY